MEQQQQQEDRPWADAPPEVLTIIIRGLASVADRFRFSAVCRRWHGTERQLPKPKQLPWLALPIPSYAEATHCSFVSLPDESAYELPFPVGGGRARYCGSAPGGWLVVAHRERGNLLCNAFTGATVPLPHQATIRYDGHPVHGAPDPEWNRSEAYIRKAVLSAPPDAPEGCVVAAIVNKHTLAVCRPGRQSAWCRLERRTAEEAEIDFEDVVFYRGKLCALDARELVHVFAVTDGGEEDGGRLKVTRTREGRVGQGIMRPRPERDIERDDLQREVPLSFLSRYLVESGGRLLLVLRYARADRTYSVIRRTYMFRVLELVPGGPEQKHLAWVELDGLGGEVLFVGGSGSVSLTASEYFRGEADADCIYFTDDNFHVATAAKRELPCRDIGRYSMRDRSVTFLDVQAPHNSRSPPTWLYVSD